MSDQAQKVSAQQEILKAIAGFVSGYAIADPKPGDKAYNFAISVAATQVLDPEDNVLLVEALNKFVAAQSAALCPTCKGTGRVAKDAPVPRGVPREYDHHSDCACSLRVEDAPEEDK